MGNEYNEPRIGGTRLRRYPLRITQLRQSGACRSNNTTGDGSLSSICGDSGRGETRGCRVLNTEAAKPAYTPFAFVLGPPVQGGVAATSARKRRRLASARADATKRLDTTTACNEAPLLVFRVHNRSVQPSASHNRAHVWTNGAARAACRSSEASSPVTPCYSL